jgi:hypothetical protein
MLSAMLHQNSYQGLSMLAQQFQKKKFSGCRCTTTLTMAFEQCKRAKVRDKEGDDKDVQAPQEAVTASAPAALLAFELTRLSEQMLDYVHEREQKVWSLQLDVRDLRTQVDDLHASERGVQVRSLLVRT